MPNQQAFSDMYTHVLTADDFTYYHTSPGSLESLEQAILSPGFAEATERFGISVSELPWGELPAPGSNVYVLVGPIDMNDVLHGGKYANTICRLAQWGKTHDAQINLLGAHPWWDEEAQFLYHNRLAPYIPQLDNVQGINTLFPDSIIHGWLTNSIRDVVDNLVCETIRIKYSASKEPDVPHSFTIDPRLQYEGKLQQLSKVFKHYQLWHRGPTDGAILIKRTDGWILTQTKTNKIQLDGTSVSHVTLFDAQRNHLTYKGSRLPSSDAPELIQLSELLELGPGEFLVHFHYNPLTRNSHFADRTTSKEIEYGLASSGTQIAKEWSQLGGDWIILKHHGMIWRGPNLDEQHGVRAFNEFIKGLLEK